MIEFYLNQIKTPTTLSHKGDNGKSLVIGGSDLFHAASQWSFAVISRFVDMTFYSSVAQNNEILLESKIALHDGVVVARKELPEYLKEVTSVLIGPGMRRDFRTRFAPAQLQRILPEDLTELDWEFDTQAVVSAVLRSYSQKQWVIDAGALQVLQPGWLPKGSILTPHRKELEDLLGRIKGFEQAITVVESLVEIQNAVAKEYWKEGGPSQPATVLTKAQLDRFFPKQLILRLYEISSLLKNATIILKGPADVIWNQEELAVAVGGNAGLTKGGTGDVLAGLITGFVTQSPALASCVVASCLNKQAGHELFAKRATMYNSSDLVKQISLVWGALQSN